MWIYCSANGCENTVTLRAGDIIPESWTCGPCNRAASQDAEIDAMRARAEKAEAEVAKWKADSERNARRYLDIGNELAGALDELDEALAEVELLRAAR